MKSYKNINKSNFYNIYILFIIDIISAYCSRFEWNINYEFDRYYDTNYHDVYSKQYDAFISNTETIEDTNDYTVDNSGGDDGEYYNQLFKKQEMLYNVLIYIIYI